MTRVLLCLSHSIEEYDQLRALHGLGLEVASIGGYIDPAHPHDPKRPALPDVPMVPAVKAAVDALGEVDNLAAAQARIPDEVLEWADVIVFHHYLERLFGQWDRIERWRAGDSARRVVWRTVGQSGPSNEAQARPFRDRGLEVVRYSPREWAIPGFAGADALIRFWKDPEEWAGWLGPADAPLERFVLNITQGLAQRDPWTNWRYWEAATQGLNRVVVGPGSEVLAEGVGEVDVATMRGWLREAGVYLYTGTQPASYTLGLLEALMVGVPVVSIGPGHMRLFPWGPRVFEGHELAEESFEDPEVARAALRAILAGEVDVVEWSARQRATAVDLFGPARVWTDWADFLTGARGVNLEDDGTPAAWR